ncbi:hypothetical protein BD560DRAFT_415176 [Blakeslea trispora]|nr:hypothetical protein BD560DRAFT_415176 [Blakeslea trispora]
MHSAKYKAMKTVVALFYFYWHFYSNYRRMYKSVDLFFIICNLSISNPTLIVYFRRV